MNSSRIQKIASLITKDNIVIDIGTDHAYLPIYLITKLGFNKIIATDISQNVLKQAIANIQKYHLEDKIKIYCTDGLKDINEKYDTIVIAGMGTNTIKNILGNGVLCNEIILQSNNELPNLRLFMQDLGYKIIKEEVVLEKGKYYVIIKYHEGKEKLSYEDIYFGKHQNKEYLTYLFNKKSKEYSLNKRNDLKIYLAKLEKFIEKIPD